MHSYKILCIPASLQPSFYLSSLYCCVECLHDILGYKMTVNTDWLTGISICAPFECAANAGCGFEKTCGTCRRYRAGSPCEGSCVP